MGGFMQEIQKTNETQANAKAIIIAITVGIIAGGISWMMYKRPAWRQNILSLTRQALSVAESSLNNNQ
jgi:hypothetical protein